MYGLIKIPAISIVSWLSVDITFIYIMIPVWFLFCRRNCNRFVNELWRSCYPVFYMCYSLLYVILSFFCRAFFWWCIVICSFLQWCTLHGISSGNNMWFMSYAVQVFGWSKRWAFFHVPGSAVWIREPEPSKPTYFWRPYHDHFKHFLWLLFLWWAKSIHLKLICETLPMNSTARFGLVWFYPHIKKINTVFSI